MEYTNDELDAIDARVDALLPITRDQQQAITKRYDEQKVEWIVVKEPGAPEGYPPPDAMMIRQYVQAGYKVIEIREGE